VEILPFLRMRNDNIVKDNIVQQHTDDVMVGNITFYHFGGFRSVAVIIADKLQFLNLHLFIYL